MSASRLDLLQRSAGGVTGEYPSAVQPRVRDQLHTLTPNPPRQRHRAFELPSLHPCRSAALLNKIMAESSTSGLTGS
jgi:hypothetical protein